MRKTDGYLPTAEVAFIDEIFKANSAILNALLTLLNERLFDNGNERYAVPLLCLVRRITNQVATALQMPDVLPTSVRTDLSAVSGAVQSCSCRCHAIVTNTRKTRPSCVHICDAELALMLRRSVRPTSCQRVRSWMRCTIASSSAARLHRCAHVPSVSASRNPHADHDIVVTSRCSVHPVHVHVHYYALMLLVSPEVHFGL